MTDEATIERAGLATPGGYSSVQIERGQRGSYGWTIKVYREPGQEDEALAQAKAIDQALRLEYGAQS